MGVSKDIVRIRSLLSYEMKTISERIRNLYLSSTTKRQIRKSNLPSKLRLTSLEKVWLCRKRYSAINKECLLRNRSYSVTRTVWMCKWKGRGGGKQAEPLNCCAKNIKVKLTFIKIYTHIYIYICVHIYTCTHTGKCSFTLILNITLKYKSLIIKRICILALFLRFVAVTLHT